MARVTSVPGSPVADGSTSFNRPTDACSAHFDVGATLNMQKTDWKIKGADGAAELLRSHLDARLSELEGMTEAELVEHRYVKFRKMGNFFA